VPGKGGPDQKPLLRGKGGISHAIQHGAEAGGPHTGEISEYTGRERTQAVLGGERRRHCGHQSQSQ